MDDTRCDGPPPRPVLLGRRVVLRAGAGLGLAALAVGWEPAAAATQAGWRFCVKCRGLFFQGSSAKPKKKKKGKKGKGRQAADASLGVCPAGGKHAPRTDLSYVLHTADSLPTNADLFKNFQQCIKCRALFANDRGDTGACPAGGAHASGDPDSFFALWQGATVPGMDDAWDECAKCSGVYNYAGGSIGSCPAGGGHERRGASTRYTLFVLS